MATPPPTLISAYLIALFVLCNSPSLTITIAAVHAVRFPNHLANVKIDANFDGSRYPESAAADVALEYPSHGDSNGMNSGAELQEMNHSNKIDTAAAGEDEADLAMLEEEVFNYYSGGHEPRHSINSDARITKANSKSAPTLCPELYVVKEGETLHSISASCDAPFINILLDNPHVEDTDDNISAGSVLLIKGSGHT